MKIKKATGEIGHVLEETFKGFIDDDGLKLSAALSFYTIFSLPPLLIIIISLCGAFFGADAVRGEIFGQINGFVGNAAALQIQETIKHIKLSTGSAFATASSFIILLIGASGAFSEIQDSINRIWGIKAKSKRHLLKFTRNSIMSVSMIGSAGFLLMVALIVNSLADILNKHLTTILPQYAINLFHVIDTLIVFVIITVFFGAIFKTLPDGKIAFRDCIIGASFTAILFMIGKFVIGIYLGRYNIASIYGAAGSVIAILVWVYYSAAILYFGAEFTKVYARTNGQEIIPNAYSERIKK